MKKNSVVLTTVLYGIAAAGLAHAQAGVPTVPTKIAVINLSEAMAKTKEGQKAGTELSNKFGPKKAEYDRRETEIQTLTDQLNKGQATMSDEKKRQISADITSKTTSLKRYGEDSQNDMDTEEQKITQDIQTKMGPILQSYAIQNNFAVVLDVGSQQSPVLWFATATNVTDILVALYDQAHPVKEEAGTKAPVPAAKAPVPAAKPPAAPPKKQ